MNKLNIKAVKEYKKFPPEATDLNKIKNSKGFWNWDVADAKKYSGASFERALNMGDLIMFMNMAALGWERIHKNKK